MPRRLALISLVLAVLLAAAPAPPRAPLVLAASSLQESLTAAADAWACAGHPRPVVSFASSAVLARQAIAGAPGDLFISADQQWMDAVDAKGLLRPGTRADLLGNRLVLVAPRGARMAPVVRARDIVRAVGGARLAMADPDSVPAGRYGRAALTRLGAWPAVAGKVVRAENVRAALALVERGAARLGIVYATDARASAAVRVVAVFPAASHPPIRYPLAILKAARSPDASAFHGFLLSPRGRAIFARYGFGAPR